MIELENLKNMLQKQFALKFLTASATVDGNDVNMLEDDGSPNALAPLTVFISPAFDLPKTGNNGVLMYGVIGITMMAVALLVIVVVMKKSKTAHQ